VKRDPAQVSAPNLPAQHPRQAISRCLFLERRVAAHRPKGNLNLSYEALSQSFFRQVLQICTPAPTSQNSTKPLFFWTFRGLAFVTRESLTTLQGSIFEVTFGSSVDSWRCDGCFESKQTRANRARFCAARNSASPSGAKTQRDRTRHQNSASISRGVGDRRKNKAAAGSADRSGAVRPIARKSPAACPIRFACAVSIQGCCIMAISRRR
jgi:hypothetical protein